MSISRTSGPSWRQGHGPHGDRDCGGDNRAVEAAQRASPARFWKRLRSRGEGRAYHITASRNSLRLQEVDAAAKIIEEAANSEDTIFGAVYDDTMGAGSKITVIATGFNAKAAHEAPRSANVIPLQPQPTYTDVRRESSSMPFRNGRSTIARIHQERPRPAGFPAPAREK